MMDNNTVIMNTGMDCLIQKLGIVGTEQFISNLIREPFDYTEWQRVNFEAATLDGLNSAAVRYCEQNPMA